MPPAKIAIVALPNERADLIIGMAPPDLEIFLVDINQFQVLIQLKLDMDGLYFKILIFLKNLLLVYVQ